jgi:diguanylate cyclase (GGDEF)-like protein
LEQIATFATSGYTLEQVQLFQGAAHDSIAPLLAACPVVRLAQDEPVAEAADRQGCLYVVLRGALSVMQADVRPGSDRVMSKVLPGECVGELSVLDHGAPPDQIAALEVSDVLAVPADILWRLIDESNGVARNLLRLLSFRVRAANAQLRRRQKVGEFYRQLSMVDGLTSLHNRAWLDDRLPVLISHAYASGEPLSLIMIDIDHFKRFNDDYGHQTGDTALITAAKAVSSTLRPSDFAARYGGEEMTVLLPGTNEQAARVVAHRLCEQVRQAVVFMDMHKPLPHITASFGIATLASKEDAGSLLARADAALYRAKNAGRDRVSL